jgi:hypothetical protein
LAKDLCAKFATGSNPAGRVSRSKMWNIGSPPDRNAKSPDQFGGRDLQR